MGTRKEEWKGEGRHSTWPSSISVVILFGTSYHPPAALAHNPSFKKKGAEVLKNRSAVPSHPDENGTHTHACTRIHTQSNV